MAKCYLTDTTARDQQVPRGAAAGTSPRPTPVSPIRNEDQSLAGDPRLDHGAEGSKSLDLRLGEEHCTDKLGSRKGRMTRVPGSRIARAPCGRPSV